MSNLPAATRLYRHYGPEGDLLYIGVSLAAITRLEQHISDSHWADQICRVEIETYPDQAAAREAERCAIKADHPLHNRNHNLGSERKTMRMVFSHTTAWRKRADKAAAKLKVTRAELIRRALDAWLDKAKGA